MDADAARLRRTGWFGPDALPDPIMAADPPAIRHVLSGNPVPLVE